MINLPVKMTPFSDLELNSTENKAMFSVIMLIKSRDIKQKITANSIYILSMYTHVLYLDMME